VIQFKEIWAICSRAQAAAHQEVVPVV